MEVGEDPAVGGGVWNVTGRVFDWVATQHEFDVGEEGEGLRYTGNVVAASVDGERRFSNVSEHHVHQLNRKHARSNGPFR